MIRSHQIDLTAELAIDADVIRVSSCKSKHDYGIHKKIS